jgi:integrase
MTWAAFVLEYREKVQAGKKTSTCEVEDHAIANFERHCSPTSLMSISTKTIDEFRTKRSRDKNKKKRTKVSSSSVNKDLRAIRVILKKAHEWRYIPDVPKFTFMKVNEPEPRAIPISEFNAILAAVATWDAGIDRRPTGWRKGCVDDSVRVRKIRHKAPAAGWWLAFLSAAYYAGLRWGELLNLRWKDLRFTATPNVRIWNEKASRWDHVPLSATLTERLQTWMGISTKVMDV